MLCKQLFYRFICYKIKKKIIGHCRCYNYNCLNVCRCYNYNCLNVCRCYNYNCLNVCWCYNYNCLNICRCYNYNCLNVCFAKSKNRTTSLNSNSFTVYIVHIYINIKVSLFFVQMYILSIK